jgi:formamidase
MSDRRSLLVAGLQTAGTPNDVEATLAEFERRVRSLAAMLEGLQLVLAPELHLMALPPMLDELDGTEEERAVEIPGPLTERLGALAKDTGLWLVPGSVYERAAEGVYNTAVVLSPEGELVATYRKCFPWQPYETSLPGHEVVGFEIEGMGRIGLAICHDGVFPEVFRQLTWDGAEAILQVSLTRTSDREAEIVVARANAIVNQVYLINVNAASPVGNGRSVVVDPEGIVSYEAGAAEEVVTAVVDFDAVALVRERGSFGLNRLLEQLDRHGAELDLPMYGGRYRPSPRRR